MRLKPLCSRLLKTLLIASMVVFPTAGSWAKPKFKVLAQVPGGLWTGLTLDAKGNLYGVTSGGGVNNVGSVFELTPNANGKWTLTTLHSFNGTDGTSPNGNLIFDAAGNLYGTTAEGGAYVSGTAFELTPDSGGWTFTDFYDFCHEYGCPDGGDPSAGFVMDGAGNLYDSAPGGTCHDFGVAFEFTPGSGGWDENILFDWGCRNYDATASYAPLTLNKAGDLYGTSYNGGRYGGGTVFKLTREPGVWKERLLYSFCKEGGYRCSDGSGPEGDVILDAEGNVYGTTNGGGPYGAGTIFELRPSRREGWKRIMLYDFADQGKGVAPVSVVRGATGTLYGTAALGGNSRCNAGCGAVFKLAPRAHGKWAYTVLHKFDGPDGYLPDGGVVLDKRGNLYGVAFFTVFEITP
jgi:uncharacterized repeat protein (TIGR03803 family)